MKRKMNKFVYDIWNSVMEYIKKSYPRQVMYLSGKGKNKEKGENE